MEVEPIPKAEEFVLPICVSFVFWAFVSRQNPGRLRKEVIQPHLPVQLPCYDVVPLSSPAFSGSLREVSFPIAGVTSSHDVTGGVYKARERIHRNVLICGY